MTAHIQAIIWDYDGTLVDTRHKNFAVTRRIVEQITGHAYHAFPALQSLDRYDAVTRVATNWREMYAQQYAMTPDQIDRAGRLWAELQLTDTTPVPVFGGIAETLAALQHFPHGIVSQNARGNIEKTLKTHAIDRHFGCVIGFEEVNIRRQKPEPDGLLHCIEQLAGEHHGVVLYIGDHDTDFTCANNARIRLQHQDSGVRVVSIGVTYAFAPHPPRWNLTPDYRLATPEALIALVNEIK